MADVSSIKIAPLMDTLPELGKKVYALQLLTSVDYESLDKDYKNFWMGLLYDCVEVLDSTYNEVCSIASTLDDQIKEVRSGSSAKL